MDERDVRRLSLRARAGGLLLERLAQIAPEADEPSITTSQGVVTAVCECGWTLQYHEKPGRRGAYRVRILSRPGA